LPLPSSPALLTPVAQTVPLTSFSRATVVLPPEMDRTFWALRASCFTKSSALVLVPSPNWPLVLVPRT